MTDIGVRLLEYRIRTNSKMPAIAAVTGIAKETLYKWEKGSKPSDINDYFKLKSYLDRMENKPDKEDFEFEMQKPATLRLPFSNGRPPVPQTNGRTATGTVILTNNEPELIIDRLYAPFLDTVEGVVEVTGDSMEPTFKSGCRVAITRLNDYRMLDWGLYYYIIDTNWKGLVRRVYQGDTPNTIRLVSDSPYQERYPPIQRNWDQIKTIFKIIAWIIKQ